jgi:HK97 family phage portal protein
MNAIQKILVRMAGVEVADATKALTRPIWWGDVWSGGASADGATYGDSEQGWLGAVKSNVWAYNSVKARMSAVAQAPMKLYKGKGDQREEVEDHPALDVLKTVNAVNLNARSFRQQMEQQLSIFGRCIVHKVRGVTIRELYILPMTHIEVVPDPVNWIAGYRWLPTGMVIPRADIIDIFYPSADGDPTKADSPTQVALNAINRYNLADTAQASIDKRGGQKGGLVVHPDDQISEDFARIADDWDRRRGDPTKAGKDMHVPFGTTYIGDAFSAGEMQREQRNSRLAKEIMAAYGVPPAAAGDYSDASVLANAATQMRAFWEMFATDELALVAEELTFSLLWAEYPGAEKQGLYFEHDLDDIPAMREDADARANRSVILLQGGILSINEARELAGYDKVDDPAADAVALPVAADDPASDDPSDPMDDLGDDPGDPEDIALADEVDALLAEAGVKAFDEAKIKREGGKFAKKEGEAVSPVTGRSLASTQAEKPKKPKKAKKTDAEKQAEKDKKAEERKKAKIEDLTKQHDDLSAALDKIKDKPEAEKLKKKIEGAMKRITARRDALASGKDAGTQGLLNEAAGVKALAIVDFVGMVAVDADGNRIGTIEKIARFGDHGGLTATKAAPVVYVDGTPHMASDVRVLEGGD